MQKTEETHVQSLTQEDPLEKEMVTHSSLKEGKGVLTLIIKIAEF